MSHRFLDELQRPYGTRRAINIPEPSHIVAARDGRYCLPVVEFKLRIEAGEGPPCGDVGAQGAATVTFVGWLGLLRCLSDLLESARGEVVLGGLDGERDPRS